MAKCTEFGSSDQLEVFVPLISSAHHGLRRTCTKSSGNEPAFGEKLDCPAIFTPILSSSDCPNVPTVYCCRNPEVAGLTQQSFLSLAGQEVTGCGWVVLIQGPSHSCNRWLGLESLKTSSLVFPAADAGTSAGLASWGLTSAAAQGPKRRMVCFNALLSPLKF